MRRVGLLLGLAFAAAALPREARAELLFEDQGTDALGTQPCNGQGCWTNYARITDLDGDGDLDLVGVNTGGFFSNPTPQPLAIWLNDGAGNFSDGAAAFGAFVGSVRQIAFGDVDGDGDLDAYLPAAGGEQADALYIQGPAGTFGDEASVRLPAGLSSDAGAARFGDVDGDGDLDLLVATGYLDDNADPARLYLNDGAGQFTEAVGALPTDKNGVNPDDIDLADVDGDFDLDVYINMHAGDNLLWLNDGAGMFTDASATLPAISMDAQYHYGPVFCDVDGDGDRDLFIDNTADGYREQLLINDGSGSFADETAERITGNPFADDNIVACLDYDGDGDFDFTVGALNPGLERVFQNDGAGNFTLVQDAFDGQQDPTLWMDFGDLNGDGRLDAFTAQGEGSPELERIYLGNAAVAVDTRPPAITAKEPVTLSSSAETVVRFAVADNAVTDDGPRLQRAWVEVGDQQIEARFIGGDLYRAVVPATPEADFTPCATDWAGNTTAGCEGGQGGAGGGGGGGQGGSGGGLGGGGGAGTGTGGGGTGGAPAGPDVGDDGGCGCAVPGDSGRAGQALAALALAAGLAWRRRRAR